MRFSGVMSKRKAVLAGKISLSSWSSIAAWPLAYLQWVRRNPLFPWKNS